MASWTAGWLDGWTAQCTSAVFLLHPFNMQVSLQKKFYTSFVFVHLQMTKCTIKCTMVGVEIR
jgi:hypothetical protein